VANSRSARKRIRASERKHLRNRGVRSAVRTRITKARRALLGADAASSPELVLAAVRELDRAAEKGILHRNNANRRKSRLMAMAQRLTQAAGEEQAAARSAAAGGEKGRSARGAKATTSAKSGAKTTAKTATKSGAKTTAKAGTRATSDKPKTTTRTKKA
jgi:small subunit ribosomal protein S20